MAALEEWPAALLDPARPAPLGLETWNGSDPAHRFGIYRNNVLVSLVDSLADTFPVVAALVGDEFFRAMAGEFVRANLPTSPILYRYGADLPRFLTAFPPAGSLPYLADVARLEFACVRALHAAEGATLPAETLERLLRTPGLLPGLRVRFDPAFLLLSSRYAIVSIWSAHQERGTLGGVDPLIPEHAWIQRHGHAVRVQSVGHGEMEFSAALLRGETLHSAADAAHDAEPGFNFSAGLVALLERRVIVGFVGPSASESP